MKIRIALVLAAETVMAASCTTQKLCDATNPDATVTLSADQVSEAALCDRGVPYLVDSRGNFHIGKTSGQRIGDHAMRFMFTPATVFIDVAPVAALVSAQLFLNDCAIDSGGLTMPLILPPTDR